jgi:hypothetical protein
MKRITVAKKEYFRTIEKLNNDNRILSKLYAPYDLILFEFYEKTLAMARDECERDPVAWGKRINADSRLKDKVAALTTEELLLTEAFHEKANYTRFITFCFSINDFSYDYRTFQKKSIVLRVNNDQDICPKIMLKETGNLELKLKIKSKRAEKFVRQVIDAWLEWTATINKIMSAEISKNDIGEIIIKLKNLWGHENILAVLILMFQETYSQTGLSEIIME